MTKKVRKKKKKISLKTLVFWKQNVSMANFRCIACIPCRSPCLSSKQAVHYYELIYSRSIRHTPSMLSLTNTITSYMGSLQRHNGSLRTCTVAYLQISEEKHFNKAFQLLHDNVFALVFQTGKWEVTYLMEQSKYF